MNWMVRLLLSVVLSLLLIKGIDSLDNKKYPLPLRIIILLLVSLIFLIGIAALGILYFRIRDIPILVRIFYGALLLFVSAYYIKIIRSFLRGIK